MSIFPQWGHFPSNFQSPLAAKLLIGSKNVRWLQKWYHHAQYGENRSRAGCRRQSVMFIVCLSRFGITRL